MSTSHDLAVKAARHIRDVWEPRWSPDAERTWITMLARTIDAHGVDVVREAVKRFRPSGGVSTPTFDDFAALVANLAPIRPDLDVPAAPTSWKLAPETIETGREHIAQLRERFAGRYGWRTPTEPDAT